MDTIVNVAVSITDTMASAAAPKEEVLHSCPAAMPFCNVAAICVTVAICLLIIAAAVWKCFIKAQEVKKHEMDKKFEADKDRYEFEQNFKRLKDQYDSAWRTFEYMLKDKLPKDSEDAGEEAKKYIKYFWGQKTSDTSRAPQP